MHLIIIIPFRFIAGDILAKSFKWIYAKCFLCRICPNIARRRLAREKHKEKLRQNNGEDPVKRSTKLIYSCDKNFINICLSGARASAGILAHISREIWIVKMSKSSQLDNISQWVIEGNLFLNVLIKSRLFRPRRWQIEFEPRAGATGIDRREIENFYLIRKTNKLSHNCLMNGPHSSVTLPPAESARGEMSRRSSLTNSAILMKFIDFPRRAPAQCG